MPSCSIKALPFPLQGHLFATNEKKIIFDFRPFDEPFWDTKKASEKFSLLQNNQSETIMTYNNTDVFDNTMNNISDTNDNQTAIEYDNLTLDYAVDDQA